MPNHDQKLWRLSSRRISPRSGKRDSRLGRWLRAAAVVLGLLVGRAGLHIAPHLYAAWITFLYPREESITFTRAVEPENYLGLGDGGVITVTNEIVNFESVDLRGFYFSDQAPNGWPVGTISVTVDGTPVLDFSYESGNSDEVYAGFTPHRWMLEVPQGDGSFSPANPVESSGGGARLVYTLLVQGQGSAYDGNHHGWAGWLASEPAGTAVFGYQYYTNTVNADFSGSPRLGLAPLAVSFTDLSAGDILTHTWDFGDGDSSTMPNPNHVYTMTGSYTVSLAVQNELDTDSMIRTDYIHVSDHIYPIFLPAIMRSCSSETCQGDLP